MLEKHYKSMNEQLAPDKAIVNKVLAHAPGKTNLARPRLKILRKLLITAAMLLICTVAVVPTLAANVPAIYELMYLVSPRTAQFFRPVQKSSEVNGIKLEVVATYIHENTVEVYVTLQDLIADRVDETTDLNDSYSIHRPFGSSAYCERVGFDEATRTATFLITITEWGTHKIEGSKLTFSVRNFISKKNKYHGVVPHVDLGTVHSHQATKVVSANGGGGINYEKYRPFLHETTVLVPSQESISLVDGIDLTGIGYIDGKLRLQIGVKDLLRNDNHASFHLRDKEGNERLYDYSVRFIEYAEPGNNLSRVDYSEYVFDIPQGEIASYTLYGSFYTSGLNTEGKWQVTFPLQQNAVK